MSSRAGFAALLAALAILVACAVWFMQDPDAQAIAPENTTPEERTPDEISGSADDETRDALAEEGAAPVTETTEPLVPVSTTDELHHIRGRVVEEETGSPLADCTIYFDNTQFESTDEGGGFELHLPKDEFELGTFHSFAVVYEEASLFSGNLPLELEMTLRVPPRLRLRGRLRCTPEVDYESITMLVRVPTTGTQDTEMFAGLTNLSAEGRFELLISAPVPTDRYHLFFGDLRSSIVDAVLPVALLTEGEGPTIEAHVTSVTLRTQRPDGTPIKAVDVRIFPITEEAMPRWTVLSMPESGELEFLLADGPYELCAGHPEYLAVVRDFSVPEDKDILLTLEPVESLPGVKALVLTPGGEPLENALITVAPRTHNRDASVAGSVQRRTDAAGIAVMPVAQGLPYDWAAFHGSYGLIERDEVVAGTGTVTLRFTATGAIEVVPRGRAADGPSASGPMQYVLVQRGGLGGDSGQSSRSPFLIEELPPGNYELYLYGADGIVYGEGAANVKFGETAESVVLLDAGHVLRGRVQDGQGKAVSGLTLQLVHPTWPDRVARAWGRTTTDAGGRFVLRTGSVADVGLVAIRDRIVLFERSALSTAEEHTLLLE